MKKLLIVFVCALSVLAMAGCGKDQYEGDPSRTNGTDVRFIYLAAQSNFAEIDLGQLAVDSANNENVRAFAQKMVSEHTAAQAELQTLASQINAEAPNTLDTTHARIKAELLLLDGNSFDSLYMHTQTRDHRNSIIFYEESHDLGQNKGVKDYVLKNLPHLQNHLEEAQALATNF